MIHRHSREVINNYYRDEGINQSSLKVILDSGIQKFYQESTLLQRQEEAPYELEREHFIIGSGVDCKITGEEGDFDQLYHVSKLVNKPGDGAMEVIKRTFQKVLSKYPVGTIVEDMMYYKQELYDAINDAEYAMNRFKPIEEDTRSASIAKSSVNIDYWKDLISANGKQVLSEYEVSVINTIVHNIKNHPHTAHLFIDSIKKDIVYQFPMFWKFQGIPCKGLIDMIIINHEAKKIMPIDIKTIGDFVLQFNKTVKKRRYDLQGSFYSYGLLQCLVQLNDLLDVDVRNYTISNFAFIVESTTSPGTPMIFPLSDNILNVGKIGEGRWLLGWTQALSTYNQWSQVGFDLNKRFKEVGGIIWIDTNYDYQINF